MLRALGLLLGLILALAAAGASALNIGQWSGSPRSWNHPQMAVLRALLEARGYAIQPDAPITTAALADDSAFVIAEPSVELTVSEVAALAAFVQGGGRLLVFGDTSSNPALLNETLLTPLGTTIAYGSGGATNAPLAGGDAAVDGPPHALAGALLSVTTGRAVTGGTEVAGSFVRRESLGAGAIYVFGDRLDHNVLVLDASSVNARFFANLFPPRLMVAIPALSPALLGLLALVLAIGGARRARNPRR